MANTTEVFDSSRIPGEILDLMVVNSATLRSNPSSVERWSAHGMRLWP